jgi:hypothetical protein
MLKTMFMTFLALALISADRQTLTLSERRRIEEESRKLQAESDELKKDIDYLAGRYFDELKKKYGSGLDSNDAETRQLLARHELLRATVPPMRTLVLALNDQLARASTGSAGTQPTAENAAEELSLLRLEAARLRAENAELRKPADAHTARETAAATAPADGDGFSYSGVSFTDGGFIPKLVGEVTNKSGKGYQLATFKVSFNDADKKLLGTADLAVQNLKAGQQKAFDALLLGVTVERVKSYKIQFESGF